jgi:hypothetical protein
VRFDCVARPVFPNRQLSIERVSRDRNPRDATGAPVVRPPTVSPLWTSGISVTERVDTAPVMEGQHRSDDPALSV